MGAEETEVEDDEEEMEEYEGEEIEDEETEMGEYDEEKGEDEDTRGPGGFWKAGGKTVAKEQHADRTGNAGLELVEI